MDPRKRQLIVSSGEDGYWVAECPSLQGCISQGKTKEEAISNIKQAIRGYILALEDDCLYVPDDCFEVFIIDTGDMANLPLLSGQECVKVLIDGGFYNIKQPGDNLLLSPKIKDQSKQFNLRHFGQSHIILRHDHPFAQITVPDHETLDRRTLQAIIRQVGLNADELAKILQ